MTNRNASYIFYSQEQSQWRTNNCYHHHICIVQSIIFFGDMRGPNLHGTQLDERGPQLTWNTTWWEWEFENHARRETMFPGRFVSYFLCLVSYPSSSDGHQGRDPSFQADTFPHPGHQLPNLCSPGMIWRMSHFVRMLRNGVVNFIPKWNSLNQNSERQSNGRNVCFYFNWIWYVLNEQGK